MINTSFYLRRLHSLCGLLVVGVFLLEHILTNSMALGGAQSLNDKLALMELIPKPIFLGLEIGVVAIPILFHAIYGIYIALTSDMNQGTYGYSRNWKFTLQRCTAWYLIFFLIWHVGYLRIYLKGINGVPITYELIQSVVTNPIVWILYVLGMLAAVFHFSNGITTFCMTWGITKGPRAQIVIDRIAMLICAVLSLVTIAFMLSYLV